MKGRVGRLITGLDPSHGAVVRLAEDFEAHRRVNMAHSYMEQELRADFLSKFYTALGCSSYRCST